MRNRPLAILFDFDGVIVDSEPLHYAAFAQTLSQVGLSITREAYFAEFLGVDDKRMFQRMFERAGRAIDDSTLASLLADKSRQVMSLIDAGRIAASPGAEELIRHLCRRRPLAICSGSQRREIEAILRRIGLFNCFSFITAAEDVAVGKPDPAGYLLTIRHLSERTGQNLSPADCLIIEDSPAVIQRTREAGFRVMGVASSHNPDKLSPADWVVRSLEPQGVFAAIPELVSDL